MINLLPPEYKNSVIYARRNRSLIRWITFSGIGVLGIIVTIGAGYFYINQSAKAIAKDVESSKQRLVDQNLTQTQKRTEDISNSIKLALQVLSKQVLFSELLNKIGAVMPQGSALQSFSIGKLEGGIDLQAVAVNYQTASQVQVNVADPANQIFEQADIVNISCSGTDDPMIRYPCQITIRALFAKDSPFIFTSETNKR
jgi:hypothetical protein